MFRTNGKFLGLLRHLRTPNLFHFCDASDNLKLAGLALNLCALRLAHRSRWPTRTKAAKQSWGNLLCGAARVTASQEWLSLEIVDFVNKAWHRVFPCIWRLRLYPNYAPVRAVPRLFWTNLYGPARGQRLTCRSRTIFVSLYRTRRDVRDAL